MFVLNMVTKYCGDPRTPPHSGHFTCFKRTDSCSRSRPSVSRVQRAACVCLLAEGSAAPNLWSSVNHSRIGIMLYGSNNRRKLNEQNLCLSGLHVLDDGRPNLPQNPVAAEGALYLGSHRQLISGKSRSTINAFVE